MAVESVARTHREREGGILEGKGRDGGTKREKECMYDTERE